jgi:hypothetical protein
VQAFTGVSSILEIREMIDQRSRFVGIHEQPLQMVGSSHRMMDSAGQNVRP